MHLFLLPLPFFICQVSEGPAAFDAKKFKSQRLESKRNQRASAWFVLGLVYLAEPTSSAFFILKVPEGPAAFDAKKFKSQIFRRRE